MSCHKCHIDQNQILPGPRSPRQHSSIIHSVSFLSFRLCFKPKSAKNRKSHVSSSPLHNMSSSLPPRTLRLLHFRITIPLGCQEKTHERQSSQYVRKLILNLLQSCSLLFPISKSLTFQFSFDFDLSLSQQFLARASKFRIS